MTTPDCNKISVTQTAPVTTAGSLINDVDWLQVTQGATTTPLTPAAGSWTPLLDISSVLQQLDAHSASVPSASNASSLSYALEKHFRET